MHVVSLLDTWFDLDHPMAGVDSARALAASFSNEARLLLSNLVTTDQSFQQYFLVGYSFIDAAVADAYGVAPPASDWERSPLPLDLAAPGIRVIRVPVVDQVPRVRTAQRAAGKPA